MNRIPGNITPPWAGCWGPLHSCSVSRARYLPAQRNRQPARPTPQTEAPTTPRQGDPMSRVALWNHLHIEDSCGFQWRDVDAATPEFPQDLHNTRPRVLSPPCRCLYKCRGHCCMYICCIFKIYLDRWHCIRNVTSEMNMAGNKYTVMYSVQHLTHSSSRHWSALAIRLHLWRRAPLLLLS